MKRLILVLLVLFPLMALPAFAADFEAGIRHVVVFQTGDAGELDVPLSRGFAATADVFWSERFSTQFAATFVNPEAILFPVDREPVDLGTIGLDTYSISARWHFAPQKRLAAFAGGGAAFVQIGNLDDQFDDDVEATFDSETALFVEGGLRYRLLPRLFVELSASYMPLEAEPKIAKTNVALPDVVGLDPVTVSGGVSWRF